jgi:hypothetical protein
MPDETQVLLRQFLVQVSAAMKPMVESGVMVVTISLTPDGQLSVLSSRNVPPSRVSPFLHGAAESLSSGIPWQSASPSMMIEPQVVCNCAQCRHEREAFAKENN